MVFLIGAPRSGTTLLARMLSAHPAVRGGAEPHLLTPLAHLGVWRNVDKAPYDHIVAALGQKHFVDGLPQGATDYWAACRAYCDVLYGRYLKGSGKTVCLDKTPEYATILPFITRVYPDAAYIVLTRHPAAVLSSFANSFFDGSYELAQRHDPILERYVPALAAFLRQRSTAYVHLRYEDLVVDPTACLRAVCEHIGVNFEAEMVEYGARRDCRAEQGLGDPETVKRFDRPVTGSVDAWVRELAADPDKAQLVQREVNRLDPGDLTVLGYPPRDMWRALDQAQPAAAQRRAPLTRYRLQRKLIVRGRALAQRWTALAGALRRVRLACDVLLREY